MIPHSEMHGVPRLAPSELETPRQKPTSLDKALDLCEALSAVPRGATLSELARQVRLPPATTHRLLRVLRRRGFVRQDEETGRYLLTLRWLDLSFRALGRSEIRLHAYPVMREYVLRTQARTFIAVPPDGEVTYVWSGGADEVSMYTAYGKAMPGHCSIYFTPDQQSARRLVCVKLDRSADARRSAEIARRLGSGELVSRVHSLNCTCAPVYDYSGREVARVGLFAHREDEHLLHEHHVPAAWELARAISWRLGHLASRIADE
ncbi:MAG: helix-turn-helix domain-containing protein [Luteitalea sp.]|nr:helix-turn-helix domain-containing protein [Luteitalea sp.]